MTPKEHDCEAARIANSLSLGPRIVVLGSTDFYHQDSERTCQEVGQHLAEFRDLTLITGGVEGIGERVGRSFFEARRRLGLESKVYHILPHGEPAWDYGQTLFAGADMTDRREILGRLSSLYLVIEGGPRTLHELEVASSRNATIIPVGRSGGVAGQWYACNRCPEAINEPTWSALGASDSTPEETATAIYRAVQSCLESV